LRLRAFWRLAIVVYHALDAIFEEQDVKVDQQADWNIQKSKMRQELGFIDRMERFFAL
jgi:hypothetical protein